MLKNGFFITFEGSDGCGKSTQINLLFEYLKGLDYEVVLTREPGGTKIGEKIREILLDSDNQEMDNTTEVLLYAASRAQHVNERILPQLKAGKIVICDRYVDSSIVYQGIARKMGTKIVKEINEFATGKLNPDITFYLNISEEIALLRRERETGLDRIEKEGIEFQRIVNKGYHKIIKESKNRMIPIDASKTIDAVFKEIKTLIDRELIRVNLK